MTQEDKFMLDKISNLARKAEEKYIFGSTFFLNTTELEIAKEFVQKNNMQNFMFWGGAENAYRKCLAFFPPCDKPDPNKIPITGYTINLPKGYSVSHRDILGTLMSLGIKRECIGDIAIDQESGNYAVFVVNSIAPQVESITKIARVGVSFSKGVEDIDFSPKFKKIEKTIASLRLDCFVSACTNLSREVAQNAIKQGIVRLNGSVVSNKNFPIFLGCIVSIAGFGRFILSDIGKTTKSGKLHVTINKYI